MLCHVLNFLAILGQILRKSFKGSIFAEAAPSICLIFLKKVIDIRCSIENMSFLLKKFFYSL